MRVFHYMQGSSYIEEPCSSHLLVVGTLGSMGGGVGRVGGLMGGGMGLFYASMYYSHCVFVSMEDIFLTPCLLCFLFSMFLFFFHSVDYLYFPIDLCPFLAQRATSSGSLLKHK